MTENNQDAVVLQFANVETIEPGGTITRRMTPHQATVLALELLAQATLATAGGKHVATVVSGYSGDPDTKGNAEVRKDTEDMPALGTKLYALAHPVDVVQSLLHSN